MSKTAVIVGRFQCNELTDGHRHLFDAVSSKITENDYFVVVIGDSPAQRTNRNPLSFEIRAAIVADTEYKIDYIKRIMDCPSDVAWSNTLDLILGEYPSPTLYGSRDSFISHYTGKYPTETIESSVICHATDLRINLKTFDRSFEPTGMATGIIHAQENRYPIAYPTVDVAVMNNGSILLGRKERMTTWCLIGGFVDPTDENMEAAALREVQEEVPGIQVGPMQYICSQKIDDWRYRGTKDGIITTFFTCNYHGGALGPGDDIIETRMTSLYHINMDEIMPAHQPLIKKLQASL